MSTKPPAFELPVHKVGEAPWSPAAKAMEEKTRKQLVSPPTTQSAKGRKTRRRRGGKKSKYTRRR